MNDFYFCSLLSPKRYLLANEYGKLSWGPYNPKDIPSNPNTNTSGQILPPHQTLQLKNPMKADLIGMRNHHKELKKKRHAYV